MTVALVSYSNFTTDGRVKNYAMILAEAGIRVKVFCLDDARRLSYNNIELVYCGKKYRGDSKLRYLRNYFLFFISVFLYLTVGSFSREGIEAVHVNNMPNFFVFAAVFPKLFGTRVILDNHDLLPVLYEAKFGNSSNPVIKKALFFEQYLSNVFADFTLCADHNQKEYLVNSGLPAERIEVFLNIPNQSVFFPKKSSASKEKFVLIYHGTITHRLGLDLAVDAVIAARATFPNIEFMIIGDGDLVDSLKAHISKCNAESYIKLLDPVPLERLPEYIERADAGIIPNRRSYSTDNFMLPVKLLEYLYMKKPIIAPKLSILERYFDETMLALFTAEDVNTMTEAICRLANDTNARSKLVENASRFISEHSWENQKKVYLKTLLNREEKTTYEPA